MTDLVKITKEDARTLVEQIRAKINDARALVLKLYELEGWKALGYKSWRECVVTEFAQSKSRLYQLLDAAKIERTISTPVENGQPISEKALRPLAPLEPDQQKLAWANATKHSPNPTEADVKRAVAQLKPADDADDKVKESTVKIMTYLKKVGMQGATSAEIKAETGVLPQRVSDLVKKGDIEHLTESGKKVRRRINGSESKAYVLILPKFNEKQSQPTTESDQSIIKTGKTAKPEDHIPETLTRGIMTNDMLVAGYATSTDMHGDSNVLPIGVSKLQRDEEVAHTIGGSSTFEHRKNYYKWQRYQKAHIRAKVLKILEAMNPVEVPKLEKKPEFIYQYNLGIATDLRELADMLCADLHRQADMLEMREKYAHLI